MSTSYAEALARASKSKRHRSRRSRDAAARSATHVRRAIIEKDSGKGSYTGLHNEYGGRDDDDDDDDSRATDESVSWCGTAQFTSIAKATCMNTVSALLVTGSVVLLLYSIVSADHTGNIADSGFDFGSLSSAAAARKSCAADAVPHAYVVASGYNTSSTAMLFADDLLQLRLNNIEYSPDAVVWLSAHNQFWTVDSKRAVIHVYDTLTRALLDEIHVSPLRCYDPRYPAYNARAAQVWISCPTSSMYVRFNADDRRQVSVITPFVNITSRTPGAIAVGSTLAVLIANPDTLLVYNVSSTPPDLVKRYTFKSASGLNELWHAGDETPLFVYSSNEQMIYKLAWHTLTVSASVTVGHNVLDLAVDASGAHLYVLAEPNKIIVYRTSDLSSETKATITVVQANALSIAVSVRGDALVVGGERGIVSRYALAGDGGFVADAVVLTTLVSDSYASVHSIVGLSLGCPCAACFETTNHGSDVLVA